MNFKRLIFFCFLLHSTVLVGQTFTFNGSCKPAPGDSIRYHAFKDGCIDNWSAQSGTPSLFVSHDTLKAAYLNNQESISLSRKFQDCITYNFFIKVKTTSAQSGSLEVAFYNKSGDKSIHSLFISQAHSLGWTTFILTSQQFHEDYASVSLTFKGQNNSLLIDEFSVSEECPKDFTFKDMNLVGNMQNKGILKVQNSSVLDQDTAKFLSDSVIILTGETTLNAGSDVVIGIHPCTEKTKECLPEKEKEFTIFNFLSPDGDGQNDTFYIQGLESFPETEVYIANKYGKQVFQSKAYRNDWTGADVPAGIYTYQIRLSQSAKPINGELLLTK